MKDRQAINLDILQELSTTFNLAEQVVYEPDDESYNFIGGYFNDVEIRENEKDGKRTFTPLVPVCIPSNDRMEPDDWDVKELDECADLASAIAELVREYASCQVSGIEEYHATREHGDGE